MAVARTKTFANMANDLYDYWAGSGKETITEKSSLIGARKAASGQLTRIKRQIKDVNEALAPCL
jgi:hypothetical protein